MSTWTPLDKTTSEVTWENILFTWANVPYTWEGIAFWTALIKN